MDNRRQSCYETIVNLRQKVAIRSGKPTMFLVSSDYTADEREEMGYLESLHDQMIEDGF